MDFTNRDLAFLFWLAMAAAVVLTRRGGRRALAGIVKPLLGKPGLIVVVYAAYVVGVVAVAHQLGVWRFGLSKDTIVWFLVPGLVLLFGFNKAYEERGYYVRTLVRVLGLTAIVEFYVNLAAFELWVELLLLPVLVLLSAMSAVAGFRPETTVVKRLADRIVAILGLLILAGTAAYVVSQWEVLDKTDLALTFALPVWLTAATLPFIILFSLYANYETAFMRINFASRDNPRARRRARLALVASFRFRNRELYSFAGQAQTELARSKSWAEARRIIAFHRAKARMEEAKQDFAAMSLIRYAGVIGTDWDGQPLDKREFDETKQALNSLHMFHGARHENGRYREDMLTITGGLLSKTFPESEIQMKIGPRGRSWFAWRRTVSGWVFGIGAAGAPPDEWTWNGSEPPGRAPGPGTTWTHRGFDDETE